MCLVLQVPISTGTRDDPVVHEVWKDFARLTGSKAPWQRALTTGNYNHTATQSASTQDNSLVGGDLTVTPSPAINTNAPTLVKASPYKRGQYNQRQQPTRLLWNSTPEPVPYKQGIQW